MSLLALMLMTQRWLQRSPREIMDELTVVHEFFIERCWTFRLSLGMWIPS